VNNSLRQYREEHRLTQDQLAKDLGVSRQTINSIETHKYVASLELALKIAAYFHVSVETIFSLNKEK
jgi:putative transcriptional regulator